MGGWNKDVLSGAVLSPALAPPDPDSGLRKGLPETLWKAFTIDS